MEIVNGLGCLSHDDLAHGLWNFTHLFLKIQDRDALDQLHDDVQISVIVADLIELNDIGMLHSHDALNLVFKKLHHLFLIIDIVFGLFSLTFKVECISVNTFNGEFLAGVHG